MVESIDEENGHLKNKKKDVNNKLSLDEKEGEGESLLEGESWQ